MSAKTTDDKNAGLEGKSIAELQAIFAETQRLLFDKQQAIRDDAVKQIQTIAAEAGIKVFIRIPKQKEASQAKVYQHPEDSSLQWVAKQGQKPKWLSELLKNGHSLSDLEIKEKSA